MLWRGFQKPKRLAVENDTLTQKFGKFSAQPFERGFGTTIGNALRRTLLSSIEGAAVTAVRIEGGVARVSVDHRRRRGCDRHHPQPEADSVQALGRWSEGALPALGRSRRHHVRHDRGRRRCRNPRPERVRLHHLRRRQDRHGDAVEAWPRLHLGGQETSTPTSALGLFRSIRFTRRCARSTMSSRPLVWGQITRLRQAFARDLDQRHCSPGRRAWAFRQAAERPHGPFSSTSKRRWKPVTTVGSMVRRSATRTSTVRLRNLSFRYAATTA